MGASPRVRLAVLNLFNVTPGTALEIYTFRVPTQPEVERRLE